MFDVSYAVELEYLRDEDTGVAYPGLWLEKSPDAAVHIRCTLDSGVKREARMSSKSGRSPAISWDRMGSSQ